MKVIKDGEGSGTWKCLKFSWQGGVKKFLRLCPLCMNQVLEGVMWCNRYRDLCCVLHDHFQVSTYDLHYEAEACQQAEDDLTLILMIITDDESLVYGYCTMNPSTPLRLLTLRSSVTSRGVYMRTWERCAKNKQLILPHQQKCCLIH